ncbi:MAG: methionine--tRNA ligase [Candidatus Altimarinota bacterium]
MQKKFFVTTPIYYSNGIPHIGHAYSSLLADTIARSKKLDGFQVKFSTGVDENSQKVVESSQSENMEVMDYADMMALKHKAVWDGIGIGYTDFIRTTESRHKDFVQKVLQKSYDNGDIYEGVYEGKYCVGCEAFKKESDLIEKEGQFICPDHPNKPLQNLKEKNYFFRLSKYQDKLLEFYEKQADFIVPENRFREVIEFVKGGLEDFSVSRETNKFGIPLPFDPEQVTYVWYDALFNYLTVCQGEEDAWWPADLHVIGKDIVRFHAIYWPAMLWSAGYDAPKQLLVTGHFTVDGQKMSKTIGNVIDPVGYIGEYSRDLLLNYLFSAFPIGEDGDFDRKEAIVQFNAKLSNNLGNLLNRSLTLALKLPEGKVPGFEDATIAGKRDDYISKYVWYMDTFDLRNALDCTFAFSTELNQFIDEKKPWKLDVANPSEKESLEQILATVLTGLAHIAYNLSPFFEDKMLELLTRIGVGKGWDPQMGFSIAEKGNPLYMRIDTK